MGAWGKVSHQGGAHVFVRSGATWSHPQELLARNGADPDQLGFSVAVSGDTVVVGAVGEASLQGAAYAFVGLK